MLSLSFAGCLGVSPNAGQSFSENYIQEQCINQDSPACNPDLAANFDTLSLSDKKADCLARNFNTAAWAFDSTDGSCVCTQPKYDVGISYKVYVDDVTKTSLLDPVAPGVYDINLVSSEVKVQAPWEPVATPSLALFGNADFVLVTWLQDVYGNEIWGTRKATQHNMGASNGFWVYRQTYLETLDVQCDGYPDKVVADIHAEIRWPDGSIREGDHVYQNRRISINS